MEGEIFINHEKLYTHFKGYLVGKKYHLALKALNLMKAQFEGKLRKDGVTPVYAHSLSVAAYLRTFTYPEGMEEKVLLVAILHDILEDTEYMSADIGKYFGADILAAVRLVTKKSNYVNDTYYEAILGDVLSVFVKVADRIHNLSTMLGAFSVEKIEKYIQETEDYVLPLISKAKDEYPEFEAHFENMKFVVLTQLDFARAVVAQPKV